MNNRLHLLRRLILLVVLSTFSLSPNAKGDASSRNAQEAKEMFNKIYSMVFGKQGSSLTYSVNIIGLYKTQGDICYKGKKVHYKESRYMAWEDGVTAYMVDKKKQTVNIYRADDDNKDAYLSKFKYNIDDFDFSYTTSGDYYDITASVRNSSFFGIRYVKGRFLKSNLHPVSLTIKLAFLRTTVKISNFKAGGIDDSKFVFPKSQFTNYTFTDHR